MASVERWKGSQWRARFRTPDGRSRGKVFERKLDAERFLVAMEHSKLTGKYVDPSAGKVTVGEYWQVWAGRQQWRDSSRCLVSSYYANHVEPHLAGQPMNSLRRGDIESWGARLPVAARTARQVVQYVSTMLDAAVADGLIASNPARGATRPRVEVEPVMPFTGGEVEVLRAAAPPWFGVALDLGLGAGLRQSEATGLTLDRCDFLRRRLTVDRQLVSPLAGDPTFGPPKTRRSYRTIPLADAGVGPSCRAARHRPGRAPTARAGRCSATSSALRCGLARVREKADAHLLPGDHDRARSVVEAAFAPASCVTHVSRAAVANLPIGVLTRD